MSLGPPIRPEKPPEDEWQPVPGRPGIERNAKGQLRTNVPLPDPGTPIPWPWPNYPHAPVDVSI